MNTERRHQQRRHDDIFPVDLVNEAARRILAEGGIEIQKVDGRFVQITVTPIDSESATRMINAAREVERERASE